MPHVPKLVVLFLAVAAWGCSSLGAPEKYAYDAEPSAEASAGIIAHADATSGLDHRLTFNLGAGGWEDSVEAALQQDYDVELATPPLILEPERLLVYSGSFQVAVGDVDRALDATKALAEELGGYFQSLSDRTITIRVPAQRWEETLNRVAALGRVLSRQIQAADVTEEVVDLKLRLRNALALGKRLEELLEMAKTVEETLQVEKELNRVRTEIERLEGRLQFLSDRIAFSTLVIEFQAAASAPVRPQALPFPWLRSLGLSNLLGLSGGVR